MIKEFIVTVDRERARTGASVTPSKPTKPIFVEAVARNGYNKLRSLGKF